MTLTPHRHRIRAPQQGQAAVEFAFVVVSLVILMVSILEMTMFVYTYSTLTNAAKEGVRFAVVHGSSGTNSAGPAAGATCTTSGSVVGAVDGYAALSLHSTSSMTVNVCYPNGNSPGNTVQVGVSYPYQPLFGLRWANVTVSASSAGRIVF